MLAKSFFGSAILACVVGIAGVGEIAKASGETAANSESAFIQVTEGNADAHPDQDLSIYKRIQAALVKSQSVLQAALRRPEIKELSSVADREDRAFDWLQKNLRVEFPNDCNIMQITFLDAPLADRVVIVNAIAEAYLNEIVNEEQLARLRQRDVLERSYKQTRDEVREKFDTIHKLQRDVGQTSAGKMQRHLATRRLDSLSDRRNQIENRIDELDLQVELVEKGVKPAPETDLKAEREIYERHLARLGERIEKQIESLGRLEHSSAELEIRNNELDELQKQLRLLGSELKAISMRHEGRPPIQLLQRAAP